MPEGPFYGGRQLPESASGMRLNARPSVDSGADFFNIHSAQTQAQDPNDPLPPIFAVVIRDVH